MTREELDNLSYEHPIIFFDGVCGFCSASLDWIMRADDKEVFRYCTLQDEMGLAMRQEIGEAEHLDTVIGLYKGRVYTKTDVTVLICDHLGGNYKFLGRVLEIIPRPLRDIGYNLIARYRYQIMGKMDECYLPSSALRSRFVC